MRREVKVVKVVLVNVIDKEKVKGTKGKSKWKVVLKTGEGVISKE